MQRKLLDILACPIDKHYPLVLYEFNSQNEKVIDGALFCEKCSRFYPIVDEIPSMLPDELRKEDEEVEFLTKWSHRLPAIIVYEGKPWHLKKLST